MKWFKKQKNSYELALESQEKMIIRIENMQLSTEEKVIYQSYYDMFNELMKEQLEINEEVNKFIKNPTTYKQAYDIKQKLKPFKVYFMRTNLMYGDVYKKWCYLSDLQEAIKEKAYFDIDNKLNYGLHKETSNKNIEYFNSLLDKWIITDKRGDRN